MHVFLSNELLVNAPVDKEIVVVGGFEEETEVRSSIQSADVTPLMVTHEETDTRLVLHAVNCSKDDIVVSARDTDVLLLLVAHFPRVQCRTFG